MSPRVQSKQSDAGSRTHGWKPSTLKTPFHLFTIGLSLFFVAIIEVLIRMSDQNGALFFADPNTGKLPSYTLFCFEYLPTIIGVLHNTLWTTVDHDIKRIEPFFQLSIPGGVSAKNSLLLDYPFQFGAFVPYTAIRRRHWVVFCSGTVALLTAYAVTPLMSAILTRETVTRTIDFEVTSNAILPMEQQSQSVSALFAHLAYRHKYLNASLPPFSTEEFGVLPFYATEEQRAPTWLQTGELWTVNTTIYQADLDCTPAISHRNGGPGNDTIISNDRDCQFKFLSRAGALNETTGAVMLSSFSGSPYTAVLMSHTDYRLTSMLGDSFASDQSSPYTLSSPFAKCENNHEFLAIWNRYEGVSEEVIACINAPTSDKDGNPIPNLPECFTGIHGGTTPTNYSAIFCQPKYYEQAVEVTVDAASGRINSALMLESRKPFDYGVNSTFFEHIATYGKHAAATAALNVSRDYGPFDDDPFGAPDVREIMRRRQQFQYEPEFNQSRFFASSLGADSGLNVKLTYPKSMFGLAILNEQDLDGLLEAENLAESLRDMYKLYFAFAVSSELTQPSTTKLSAQRAFKTEAYVIDPVWARLLQAAFSLMAVFDAVMTYLLYNRRLNLNSDPGSLASLLQSVTTSPALLSDFRGSEFVSFKETAEKLCSNGNRYQLIAMQGGGQRIDKVVHTSMQSKPLPQVPTIYENSAVATAGPQSARPWELSTWTGAGVFTLFLGLIVLFTFLNESGRKYNGLPRLSNNTFLRNLAFSYAPTIASTLIESFIVEITRFVSLIMPYHEMHRRPSSSEKSLTIHYESRPPYFILLKAIQKSHYLLACLVVAAILANVLSVALGGLFLPTSAVPFFHEAQYAETNLPMINVTGIWEIPAMDTVFYAAMRNATTETDVTKFPWTTADNYFLPFEIKTDGNPLPSSQVSRTAETWGFRTHLSCNPPTKAQINITDEGTTSDAIQPSKQITLFPGENKTDCMAASIPSESEFGSYTIQKSLAMGVRGFDDGWEMGNLTHTYLAKGEVFYEFSGTFESCAGLFASSWMRYSVQEINATEIPDPGRNSQYVSLIPQESVNLICEAGLDVARYSVTVDTEGYVLSQEKVGEDFNDPAQFITVNNSFVPANISTDKYFAYAYQLFLLSKNVQTSPQFFYAPRTDPRPQSWISFLMEQVSPGLDPRVNATATAKAFERVYRTLFPLFLQIYAETVLVPGNGTVVPGSVQTTEDRMTVSFPMFLIAVSILAFFTLVIGITYLIRPGAFIIHIPTTLAATIPLVYASNMAEEIAPVQHLTEKQLNDYLEGGNGRYGYGWFVGRDGERHLGVDREPVDRLDTGEKRMKWGRTWGRT